MPLIKCSTCGFTNPAHLVGTKSESKYLSVGDTTMPEYSEKLFFCTDSCYLDREFIKFILKRAGERWRPMSVHTCSREYPELVEEYQSKYEEITDSANRSYGLQQFRKRNGLFDPFKNDTNGKTENVNWADVADDDVLVI